MGVTLKEVAEKAGVSRSAVSRTFTEGASVSAKTREKVEKAAAKLGYSPNVLARSLTTGRTSMIGVVSNNFQNPIFLQFFDMFTRTLQDRGLRPLLINLSKETNPDKSVTMLRQYSVDGVIVASSTLASNFALAFREAGLPVVHSFGRYTASPKVHVVGIDNRDCGRMAARALVERGYTRIGFMGGPKKATSTQDREAGFLRELKKHKGVEVTKSYSSDYSFEAGRNEMARLLKSHPAEAYLCGDDVLSIGALCAVQMAGLSVPGDIGLIGVNNMEMSAWENVNLTTIHLPLKEIINASVELIVAMLEEPDRIPETRLFPCHLVERGTLRPRRRTNAASTDR